MTAPGSRPPSRGKAANRELIARYWRVGVILFFGVVIILWVGTASDSTAGTMWAGGIIGVLIGFAIAAERRHTANREANEADKERDRDR